MQKSHNKINSLESDLDTEAFLPVYRAIGTGNKRRGIKLEQTYWACLKEIAKERSMTLFELVEETQQLETGYGNLTSALRVICLLWQNGKIRTLNEITSDRIIKNMIYACTTPAIALSSDKRLHSFNEPFLRYITDRFPTTEKNVIPRNLRLVLDLQMDTLIEQLIQSTNQSTTVGIALGVDDRRIRCNINAILAPSQKQNIIIGYLHL